MNIRFWHKNKTFLGLSKKDLYHHAILMILVLLVLFIFASVSYSRILQFSVGVTAALLYVLWGYFHHKLDGDLHYQNMIEYVFIALLAIVILGGIYL